MVNDKRQPGKHRPAHRTFLRFPLKHRIMHWIFALSFIVLALTGLPLRFDGLAFLIPVFGGIVVVHRMHYVAAAGLSAVFLFHLLLDVIPLLRRIYAKVSGLEISLLLKCKRFWHAIPLLPHGKDLEDVRELILYYCNVVQSKPQFDRFNVHHKFGYLAVFWGMPVMMLSGLAMLKPMWVTRLLPGDFVLLAKLAHSEEALLAIGVIFVWHLYEVRFPFVKRMLTGRLSEEEMMRHHPLEYQRILRQRARQLRTLPTEPAEGGLEESSQ
ncbi:MAG: formate dehydrogenase subunit gamma [bacterium]